MDAADLRLASSGVLPIPVMIALPRPDISTPAEPFDTTSKPSGCDGSAKPGVIALRKFVLERLGGKDLGIVRECGLGHPSDHHEGRAWDWGLNAASEDDQQLASAFFDWALKNDAEVFRRAGLRYLIWDHQVWSTLRQRWATYDGPNPHTDHVHISVGWPGALAKTSLYPWLGGAPPNPPPIEPPPPPALANDLSWVGWAALAGASGLLVMHLAKNGGGPVKIPRRGVGSTRAKEQRGP